METRVFEFQIPRLCQSAIERGTIASIYVQKYQLVVYKDSVAQKKNLGSKFCMHDEQIH